MSIKIILAYLDLRIMDGRGAAVQTGSPQNPTPCNPALRGLQDGLGLDDPLSHWVHRGDGALQCSLSQQDHRRCYLFGHRQYCGCYLFHRHCSQLSHDLCGTPGRGDFGRYRHSNKLPQGLVHC